jgi:hypothetical protein
MFVMWARGVSAVLGVDASIMPFRPMYASEVQFTTQLKSYHVEPGSMQVMHLLDQLQ